MAIVYAHRNPSNDSVFYIGIGNHLKRSQRNEGRNTHWTRVFNKYGKNVEIIENNISVEQAKELEIFLISEIGISNLCNQTLGGEGAFGLKHSKETIERIATKNRGKKRSEEGKRKMSEANKGHIVTQETRDKISKGNKGNKKALGHKHSKESIAKMRISKKDSRLSKEALEQSVIIRRNKGIEVLELTTNKIYKLWNIHSVLGIYIPTVRNSYENNKPISRGKFKGLHFNKITK